MVNTSGYIFLKFRINIWLGYRIHSSCYSEMDFGMHGMKGLTLKYGTLKLFFTANVL